MRGVYCIFQNVVKIGKIFGFEAHSPAPIGGGGVNAVMLSLASIFGPWLSLMTKFQSLVSSLALKVKSLALALVLSLESLILFFP